jgi:hypothetical protein
VRADPMSGGADTDTCLEPEAREELGARDETGEGEDGGEGDGDGDGKGGSAGTGAAAWSWLWLWS